MAIILLALWPSLAASVVVLFHVSWTVALIVSGIVAVGTFLSLMRLPMNRDEER